MSKQKYLSVGIDVGSTFSWMSIVDPDENLILKPFKIIHNSLDSLNRALDAIKKAEESNSLKSRTFLKSTGIYHFPLFCYLMKSGFEAFVINPLITHSIKNIGIRKVKNDKLDSIGIAKLGLKPDIFCDVTGKTSRKGIIKPPRNMKNWFWQLNPRRSLVVALTVSISIFPLRLH